MLLCVQDVAALLCDPIGSFGYDTRLVGTGQKKNGAHTTCLPASRAIQ